MDEKKASAGQPAKVTVACLDKNDHMSRKIKLSLDGREFANLSGGEAVTREIAAGEHRLRADNTFLPKTVKFTVESGEHIQFETWNRAGFGSWMIEIFGSGPLYLVLERVNRKPPSIQT